MKKHLGYFLIFALVFAFVFRSLLTNITTNLIDWRDYAYVSWVINENINHLRTLDFQNLFNLNAFYPYTNTLFLSDTLITQSLIGIPFSFFTKNPILIFNLTFVTTFFLNYISVYILFNKLFKNSLLAFAGGLAIVFSPFFYTQMGHFQMQNYWPFFLILYLLVKNTSKSYSINEILIGILLAVQFLASVYLTFFTLVAISFFLLIKAFKGLGIKNSAIKLLVIILTFAIIDGVFIKGYMDARKNFAIKRDLGEYLTYSAKVSDYLFPRQNGIFYQNPIIKKWQSYNKHQYGESASFPGFVLCGLAILGIVKLGKSKKDFSLHFSAQPTDIFFLTIMLIGFLFSLGYPYIPFVKYVPFFDTIRGVARWSFLFYLGLTYFSISFLSKIKTKWVLLSILILLIADILPGQFVTFKDSYLNSSDEILRNICSTKKTIVLEVPITHFDAGTNIAEGLTYITKKLLATTYTNCLLVNGYSGYDLPSLLSLKDQFYSNLNSNDPTLLVDLLKKNQVDILRVNTDNLSSLNLTSYKNLYGKLSNSDAITKVDRDVFVINE